MFCDTIDFPQRYQVTFGCRETATLQLTVLEQDECLLTADVYRFIVCFCFSVPKPLVELHVKLLRKLGRTVSTDRWEKYLAKVRAVCVCVCVCVCV